MIIEKAKTFAEVFFVVIATFALLYGLVMITNAVPVEHTWEIRR